MMASGTCTFDTAGALTASTSAMNGGAWGFAGAAATNLTFDFTDLTMGGEENAVSSLSQDGNGTGDLMSLQVEDDGVITGIYSNGEQRVLGQAGVATFQAEWGLRGIGGNLYTDTQNSGEPAIGVAGTGGRGTITGSALERSNVNLEEQFVQMITYQRSYQANASVISAADQTLQRLVSLV